MRIPDTNRRPRQFVLDEQIYGIAVVLDQWYEPSAMYFKVQSTEGKTYLLRYDEETDEWTKMIASCEQCNPAAASIRFASESHRLHT